MKGKPSYSLGIIHRLRFLASLMMFTWLMAGSVRPGEVLQQEMCPQVISEVEPNDSPLTAQELGDCLPGQTLCIQGRVARGDAGSRSLELAAAGLTSAPIQDWFVANLPEEQWGNGPIPVRITITWQGQANLNLYAGTDVDPDWIADGFKSLSNNRLATAGNPESWPRRDETSESVVVYLQPDVDPLLINNGFGRRLIIGVQHASGPLADYQVTIRKPLTFSSETHQIDDGLRQTEPSSDFEEQLVVNRFRPTGDAALLTSVGYPFLAPGDPHAPDPTGQQIRLVVFAGDSDDALAEPPSHPTFLFDQMVTVPRTVSGIGEVVEIPIVPPILITSGETDIGEKLPFDPNISTAQPMVVTSGVVYIGFEFPNPMTTGITAVFDASPVQYLRTFASRDGGTTWYRPMGIFNSPDATQRKGTPNGKLAPGTVSTNANIRANIVRR